jgi:hypothetical protein
MLQAALDLSLRWSRFEATLDRRLPRGRPAMAAFNPIPAITVVAAFDPLQTFRLVQFCESQHMT